jgi:hypothetical protein
MTRGGGSTVVATDNYNTHTHTHTYIYIYIYISVVETYGRMDNSLFSLLLMNRAQ